VEEEIKEEQISKRSNESHGSNDDFIKKEQVKSYETETESDLDADLDFYDRIQS
jgi:hypothetical protein